MTYPIPPGTRDVLPDEMRELRAIGDRMRARFADAGYGEIHTPALEYEEVLRRGDVHAAGARYRTFDEQGDVLALRSDMTIPTARVVATRYGAAEPPLRFCYLARAWRAAERGVGEPREFLQAGIELIGLPGAEGDAEVVALTIEALDAAGLRRHRVGVGDGSLYRRLLLALDVPEDGHRAARGVPLPPRPGGPGAERGRAGSWRRRASSCSCGCPSCAAAPRCSTERTGRWPRRWRDCAPSTTCSSAAAWPTG